MKLQNATCITIDLFAKHIVHQILNEAWCVLHTVYLIHKDSIYEQIMKTDLNIHRYFQREFMVNIM